MQKTSRLSSRTDIVRSKNGLFAMFYGIYCVFTAFFNYPVFFVFCLSFYNHRTNDKHHKHYGNNRFSVHFLILLFLSVLKADKTKYACTCKGNSRKAYPQSQIEVVTRFRSISELIVHLDNRGRSDLDSELFVGRENYILRKPCR